MASPELYTFFRIVRKLDDIIVASGLILGDSSAAHRLRHKDSSNGANSVDNVCYLLRHILTSSIRLHVVEKGSNPIDQRSQEVNSGNGAGDIVVATGACRIQRMCFRHEKQRHAATKQRVYKKKPRCQQMIGYWIGSGRSYKGGCGPGVRRCQPEGDGTHANPSDGPGLHLIATIARSRRHGGEITDLYADGVSLQFRRSSCCVCGEGSVAFPSFVKEGEKNAEGVSRSRRLVTHFFRLVLDSAKRQTRANSYSEYYLANQPAIYQG